VGAAAVVVIVVSVLDGAVDGAVDGAGDGSQPAEAAPQRMRTVRAARVDGRRRRDDGLAAR
jgi:hypothetical protein